MGLREYYDKRDFDKTPEPRGNEHRGQGWSFCVQKHAATRLHYDFRLELDGVLKSWAVPKGPSYDPADKRLAMQTEDHPREYGDFEGIIPAGEYGGGTVVLWDRGRWEPLEEPHQAYAKGRLKFRLYGDKLKGAWMLVKTKGRDPRDAEKSWLLFKERDDFARPASEYDVTVARPESVATGRTLEEIGAERDRVWHSNRGARSAPKKGVAAAVARAIERKEKKKAAAPRPVSPSAIPGARKAPLPRLVKPQLATLVDEAPPGDEWLHELKLDGYRILARLQDGRARLFSRNGKDWTEQFQAVAHAAERVRAAQALLDGEVAMLLADGTTSFNALQNASVPPAGARLTYFLFDLLHLDGYDLTRVPLERRKEVLKALVPDAATLRYSDHVVGSGRTFHEQACRMKLEGIISKRRDAPYEAARSRTWLKVKCAREQEFVIGGFTDPEGSRAGIGALLLGVYDGEQLVFAGKVGTGFTEKSARELRQKLEALEQKAIPFRARPPGLARAHWVKPDLVAEVKFSEWTPDGRLRHPSFQGLREDKPARQVVREQPQDVEEVAPGGKLASPPKAKTAKPAKAMKPAKATKAVPRPLRSAEKPPASVFRRSPGGPETTVAGVRLTNPDRVLYPDLGLTKLDLAHAYETIADWVLPHVSGRPLTLVRCPEGLAEPCFYQKHTGWWAPEALRRVKIQEKTKVGEYLVVDDLAGLIGLVQIGILEIHTWNSLADDVEHPDRIIFDLDPDTALPWARVIEAAVRVRERLAADKLESFVKTTGGKGLHVVVPLGGKPSWDDTARYAEAIATEIAGQEPKAYVAEMSKAKRMGKVFLDWLRNVRGSTSIAAYSTRAKPGAPVSVPLAWSELNPKGGPAEFTVRNISQRLAKLKADPWAAYGKLRQKLPASKSAGRH
jgi:bifunctional non-homologous end joining protein LigD